ncbi:hypothetical protein ACQPZZ_37895 [Microbispora sp. CA-135349]|uniref:hypothetical protein n=1 Tax=Microbispora sp. CA-135349 TaxID=3239953 RepID=UPI003D8BD621
MADTTDVAAMTVVVQRVRVRWSKEGRGAREATRRAELGRAFPLPASPPGTPLIHDVLIDTEGGVRVEERATAEAEDVRLLLTQTDGGLKVERLPSHAAYPLQRHRSHLFTLRPGQVGRYLANFRFTGCACAPRWHYEDWTTYVAILPARRDLFLGVFLGRKRYDAEFDGRVSLYGLSR